MRHDALDAEADVDTGAGEFLDHDGFVREGSATAAVLLGHVREQQARLAGFEPNAGVGVALFGPPLLVGRKLPVDELADRCLEDPRILGHPRRFGPGWLHHVVLPNRKVYVT